MKQLLFPLILLLLAACQHDDVLPEATSAAKEVYLQYADRKDLTVALIGDYQGYNTVMLQAQTTEDWLRLCEEFGVGKLVDADALDTTIVSSLTISSFNTGNYNDLEDFMSHVSDNLEFPTGSQPASIHVDTVYSATKHMHYDHDVLVDSSSMYDTAIPYLNKQLMKTTIEKGHTGYIIRDNSDELTLWLFFYSTPAEKEQILNHVTTKNRQK